MNQAAVLVLWALLAVQSYALPPAEPPVYVTYWETWTRCATCDRIPEGYRKLPALSPEIIAGASAVHGSVLPIGAYVPFEIDLYPVGWWCGVVLLEPHLATWRAGERVMLSRPIRGATVFEAKQCPSDLYPHPTNTTLANTP